MNFSDILWFLLSGAVGGVLGGMGLGGGTLLIPLLTFFLDLEGPLAAWLNLVSFIPMSVTALIIHSKKRLVSWRDAFAVIPPATVAALLSAFFSAKVSSPVMRVSFGCFLITVGTVSLLAELVRFFRAKCEKLPK